MERKCIDFHQMCTGSVLECIICSFLNPIQIFHLVLSLFELEIAQGTFPWFPLENKLAVPEPCCERNKRAEDDWNLVNYWWWSNVCVNVYVNMYEHAKCDLPRKRLGIMHRFPYFLYFLFCLFNKLLAYSNYIFLSLAFFCLVLFSYSSIYLVAESGISGWT